MIIKGMVTQCDITGKEYSKPVEGGHMLARGATGRVCCVMHVGPEEITVKGYKIVSREVAEEWAYSEKGGYPDF